MSEAVRRWVNSEIISEDIPVEREVMTAYAEEGWWQ